MDALTASAPVALVTRWQAVLDQASGLFADLADGSRMGLVSRSAFGVIRGRHIAGVAAAPATAADRSMLVFEARRGTIGVDRVAFAGFAQAGVDLLFVVEDAALGRLEALPTPEVLGAMKLALRTGEAMFYVFRTKHELQDRGYEDFLDTLGLAFLGACR
ncbi:MAG: hypothetical protein U1F51_17590 [Burkholderiales bacterium]